MIYISLGSNLDNPKQQVEQALVELDELERTQLVASSPLYCSKPMGPQDQPDFINAVAALKTDFSPFELLLQLQQIENQHQRIRKQHWGPRTLDLDLLLYNDEVITTEHLTIPHPGIKQRDFVLKPLFDIAPELVLPCGSSVKSLLVDCEIGGCLALSNLERV